MSVHMSGASTDTKLIFNGIFANSSIAECESDQLITFLEK